MASQPVGGILFLKFRESYSLYVHIYFLWSAFSTQSYQIIFCLSHRWDPNSYYHSGLEWARKKKTMKGYFTLLRSPEQKFHNQVQFSVIYRIPLFLSRANNILSIPCSVERPPTVGNSQHIVSPAKGRNDLDKFSKCPLYVFTQPLCASRRQHKVIFLSGVLQV